MNIMNKYIQKQIQEQFNINDLDFGDDSDQNVAIFSKYIVNPQEIYDRILNVKKSYYSKVVDLCTDNEVKISDIEQLDSMCSAVKAVDNFELKYIGIFYSKYYPEHSMNWLDVSEITDMSQLFRSYTESDNMILQSYNNIYNGDISRWDVSNVRNMRGMFESSIFNGDISDWDVSNVMTMESMFCSSKFNNVISEWDVSCVKNMSNMFGWSEFTGDISGWDVSAVTDMHGMFQRSLFNNNISDWDVSNVTDMSYMFYQSAFNGDISRWDVSAVLNMNSMFYQSYFNRDISKWDVSHVKNMNMMFMYTQFNHDISKWDVHNVKSKGGIFKKCFIKPEYMPPLFRNQNE